VVLSAQFTSYGSPGKTFFLYRNSSSLTFVVSNTTSPHLRSKMVGWIRTSPLFIWPVPQRVFGHILLYRCLRVSRDSSYTYFSRKGLHHTLYNVHSILTQSSGSLIWRERNSWATALCLLASHHVGWVLQLGFLDSSRSSQSLKCMRHVLTSGSSFTSFSTAYMVLHHIRH